MSYSPTIIKRGLKNFLKNPNAHFTAGPVADDIFHWEGMIFGPIGTPYEGRIFTVTVHYPPQYPIKPPHVGFKTPIYHANVDGGSIYLKMLLPEHWRANYNITTVFEALVNMLTEPELGEGDKFVDFVAEVYIHDRDHFNEKAREMAETLAGGSKST